MRRLYSIKVKKHIHIDRERIRKSRKDFIKGTFNETVNLDSVVQESKAQHEGELIILEH